MKDQCEALEAGKQQKMSVIQSFKHQQESNAIVLSSENEVTVAPIHAKVSIFYRSLIFQWRNICRICHWILRTYFEEKKIRIYCHWIGYIFLEVCRIDYHGWLGNKVGFELINYKRFVPWVISGAMYLLPKYIKNNLVWFSLVFWKWLLFIGTVHRAGTGIFKKWFEVSNSGNI